MTARTSRSSRWILREIPFLFVVLGGVLLTYSPAIFAEYGFMDDYILLKGAVFGQYFNDCWPRIFGDGRPILAYALGWAFEAAGTISGLRFLRLTGILGLAGLGVIIYLVLSRSSWDRASASFAALAICVIPSFQVLASWAALFPKVFVLVLSFAAWHLTARSFDPLPLTTKILFLTASVALLLIGFSTYQSDPLFYLFFAAIALIRSGASGGRVLAQYLSYSGVMVVSLVGGFGFLKLWQYLFPQRDPLRDCLVNVNEGLHIILKKMVWFLQEPLINVSNLISIHPSVLFASVVWVVIIVGLMLYFKGTFHKRLMMLLMALTLIPICYLPNLVARESWAAYRNTAVPGALVLFYFLVAVRAIAATVCRSRFHGRITSAALIGAFALVGCLVANYNVIVYFVRPQVSEVESIRCQLASLDLRAADEIYFVQPRLKFTRAPRVRYDEFGLLSSYHPWPPPAMVRLILAEMRSPRAGIPVRLVLPDRVQALPHGTPVVNVERKCP